MTEAATLAPREPTSDSGRELANSVIALQRAIVRAARSIEDLPPLPTAQAEIIGKIAASGPMTPVALAAELGLARPTISNLVKSMVSEGLLTRRPSESDGRSVIVDVTPAAITMTTTFLRRRDDIVVRALDGLTEPDRRWVLSALPSLRLLVDQLDRLTALEGRRDAIVTDAED